MTKIKLRMVTSLSGTMGDTTYRTLSPGNIVVSDKAALPTFENEEDKTARDARADQFGAVNALVPSVIDAVKKGFPNKPRGVSAANMFTARNAATLCTLDRRLQGLCLKNGVSCVCGLDVEGEPWTVRAESESSSAGRGSVSRSELEGAVATE